MRFGLELIYYRDGKQKDEVSVRMQNDERMVILVKGITFERHVMTGMTREGDVRSIFSMISL
jgi:hypothetical protein